MIVNVISDEETLPHKDLNFSVAPVLSGRNPDGVNVIAPPLIVAPFLMRGVVASYVTHVGD